MLFKEGHLQETHWTWSIVPIYNDASEVQALVVPNFENTAFVLAARRLGIVRKVTNECDATTSVTSLFENVCGIVEQESTDLPFMAFYDCEEALDQQKHTQDGSQASIVEGPASGNLRINAVNELDDLAAHDATNTIFIRAATTGLKAQNRLFPSQIPAAQEDEDAQTLQTKVDFLKCFRRVQRSHKMLVLNKEEIASFSEELDRTKLGDNVACIVFLPILTGDDVLRAIAIVGVSPRRAFDDEYAVFMQMLQSQIGHGIANISLVKQERRRARLAAAIIKRKNEELHSLLAARTAELHVSYSRYQKMAELLPVGISVAGPDGRITFVNDAWWAISRHSREAGPDRFAEAICDEDRERIVSIYTMVVTEGRTDFFPVEWRWKLQEGETEYRWCWAVCSVELDEAGRVSLISAALADITSKKLAERHQEIRAEEAIEMRKVQESFIDMTSHELRNPLGAVTLSVDSCIERLQGTLQFAEKSVATASIRNDLSETLRDLRILSHCATHMTGLLQDVLTLSKLDNSFLMITPIPCRPVDFLTDTFAIFKSEMTTKNITHDLEFDPSFSKYNIDYVLTDPSRVSQLVINLLTNAIKFTSTATERHITVKFAIFQQKHTRGNAKEPAVARADADASGVHQNAEGDDTMSLSCSVIDTGCGLTTQEMDRLFKRFYQANEKTHISYGGSGLGLFISRRIVQLLGGEITVSSEIDKGSAFSFWIPIKRCPPPEDEAHVPRPTDGKPRSPSQDHAQAEKSSAMGSMHVLVVEDNLLIQTLLVRSLSKQGVACDVANHGQEAIEIVQKSQWTSDDSDKRLDCILMDIEMPVLDGMQTIKVLRDMEHNGKVKGHLPILACTANAREDQVKEMLSAGFDGAVSKPFKIAKIMDAIRTLLAPIQA